MRIAMWWWSGTFQRVTRRFSSLVARQMNKIGVAVTAIGIEGIEKTWTKKPQELKVHLRLSLRFLELNWFRRV